MLLDSFDNHSNYAAHAQSTATQRAASLQMTRSAMTSLRRDEARRRASEPLQSPPPRRCQSPTLTHLTPHELHIIHDVINKQEAFERQEQARIT